VWDVREGRLVRAVGLAGMERPAALAVTADGRLAAVGDQQANIAVIEPATGVERYRIESARSSTGALTFTPDGKRLIVGLVGPRAPHAIEVYDAETGRHVRRLAGHAGPVWGLACLPDGRRMASVGGDRTLRVWDLTDGRELSKMGGHPGAAKCVAVTPDGRYAVVGTGHRWSSGWRKAESYGVQVWDLATSRSLGRFATAAAINSVAVSPDGRRALASGEDQVVHAWDMPDATIAHAIGVDVKNSTPASAGPT
jgi:WD40 repeat protein